jgi:hypothetical protein
MPDDKWCPLNPSLRKIECAHCQGPPAGSSENPVFSLKEDRFRGFPVVEVLKNGGPVHSWDTHWCFGVRKAEIMIACMPALREFWKASDYEKLAFGSRLVEDQSRNLRVRVRIKMQADFERSDGHPVDRPWLYLEALPPDSGDLGLGALKCQAICGVEQDLRNWLRKHGVSA